MAKYKDPNSWQYGGIRKRDFNQSHDGPEELPNRKKAEKKKVKRCKHDYEFLNEVVWPSWGMKADAVYKKYACSFCGKKKTDGPIYR
jgi:hypothetical protein